MSRRYATHAQMKDSGVWWLGAIPAHWEVIQSRRLFEQRKERMRSGDEQLTSSQKYGVIPQSEFMRLEGQNVMQVFTGAEILKHVEPNDFVISMRSFQGGLEWCGYAGCVSSAYVGLIPIKNVVPAFFKYLFKSKPYIQALQSTSNLVRDGQALRYQNFIQVSLPLISEEEQTQIAKFLDYETAKIDALIAKQQQLIALLQEKREGILHLAIHAKGTENIRLESCCEQINRPIHRTDDEIYYPIGLLNRGRGIFHKEPTLGYDLGDSDFFFIESGDLIFSGQFAWEGAVALAGEEETGCVATHRYPIVRGKSGVTETAFLWAFFVSQTGDFLLNESSRGAAGRNRPLNINSLMKEKIPVPPLDAQRTVAQFVFREMALHKHIQKPIELLQERRTALISAAVTGKIDVRGWQPPCANAAEGFDA